jgi:DnaJ family protein C protein 17
MLRKEEEERREQAMSSKRKRMKQDLEEKIKALSEKHGHGLDDTASSVASSSSIRKRRRQQQQQQAFDNLKRDGMKRRQEFATNQSVMEEKIRMKDLAKQKDILQNRQVRIKWSRKKLGGQSEEMLAKLCKRFGQVENVELIGNKGNAALVTFLEESSCGPCVEFYKTSDELRANFVGKRRRKEQDEEEHRPDHYHDNLNIPSSTADDVLHRHDRDRESVMERKLRQAAEREALLRRMQMGEEWSDDNIEEGGKEGTRNNTTQKRQRVSNRMALLFPPQFPSSSSCRKPIERLQELEQTMLKGLLRPEQIADMQV